MNLVQVFRRFRSGKYFLIFLSIFCVAWLGIGTWTHFDPGWGLYNLILSTEASLNGTVMVMMAEKFEKWVRDQTLYNRTIIEAVHVDMESHQVGLRQVKELSEAMVAMLREGLNAANNNAPVDAAIPRMVSPDVS